MGSPVFLHVQFDLLCRLVPLLIVTAVVVFNFSLQIYNFMKKDNGHLPKRVRVKGE